MTRSRPICAARVKEQARCAVLQRPSTGEFAPDLVDHLGRASMAGNLQPQGARKLAYLVRVDRALAPVRRVDQRTRALEVIGRLPVQASQNPVEQVGKLP